MVLIFMYYFFTKEKEHICNKNFSRIRVDLPDYFEDIVIK